MQDELTEGGYDVAIIGLNEVGEEPWNPVMTNGRDLPWLQDVVEQDVWGTTWNITYRDVVILDENNVVIGIYNLTINDLGVPGNYATLKTMFEEAATP